MEMLNDLFQKTIWSLGHKTLILAFICVKLVSIFCEMKKIVIWESQNKKNGAYYGRICQMKGT